MCNWISVKERTPTSNESVMVGSFDDYSNNGIAKAWFTNDNWYLDCEGLRATDDHCVYLDMTVTHWRPLYQPFKQQIKENQSVLTLYKVGNEKEARLTFNSILEVDRFLNGVYDSVKVTIYSDGILYNCYTTIMSTWKRSEWILSKFDAMCDKIEVKDWN